MPEKQAFQHFSNLLGFILVYSKWCKNGVQIMHRMHKMQKSDVRVQTRKNTKIGKCDHRKKSPKKQEYLSDSWDYKTMTRTLGNGSDYIIGENISSMNDGVHGGTQPRLLCPEISL